MTEEQTCDTCGHMTYCHKQYTDGCDYKQWKPLTPEQVENRKRVLVIEEENGYKSI